MMNDRGMRRYDIRAGYVAWCRGEVSAAEAGEAFDHFLAQVEANALREAADEMEDGTGTKNREVEQWMRGRADRIEAVDE